ncbi:DNA polymerase III subunit gamma/tau [Geomonas sp. RF6]|uniref:DNA polymerase III subunit gamma/tau n=1 Tax=Geomonas sp. RF6 TaxID=2897342 RepID=UPI001E5B8894|nr:DNA polymerase III subunit gamma/tau [Geomonas sp. RF6]UFS72000.1 DNA polymerase III subunit gamma/tau [Geomonas sp. RF6]
MSYLVLARKWRPQTFTDLVGQEHVSQTLKNAIDGGRVAHAFLFTGARGVGKTSSARILAKALNCETGTTTEPCNECPACQEITQGTSVDVFEIDGASNTSVDDVRELRENIKYLPSRSRYKIFIIDEVHMLSTSAFNALLKTLEEPPPHVKFIFATTEPHKVPITILSRCQRFDFKRIALPRIAARLRFIVDQEGVAISDEALNLVARKGDGSMRDALSTLDQVLAFCGATVSDADAAALLGVVDRTLLSDACRAVFSGDSRGVLQLVARVDSFGYSMRHFCQELIERLRAVAVLNAVPDGADLLDLSEAEVEEMGALARGTTGQEVQRRLQILLKAEGEMAQGSFPRLILEMALLKMTSLAPAIPVDELLRRLKALEGGVSVAAAPRPAPQGAPRPAAAPAAPAPPVREAAPAKAPAFAPPPAPASAAPAPPREAPVAAAPLAPAGADRDELWAGLVRYVKGKKPFLATFLEEVHPITVTRELLEIGGPVGSYHLKSLQDPEKIADLKAMAKGYFGVDTNVRVVPLTAAGSDTPATLAEKKSLEDARRRETLRKEAEEHPLVAQAVHLFDGEIADVQELAAEKV